MAGAGPALPSPPCDRWRPRPPPPPLPSRPHSSRIAEPPSRGRGRREVERGGGASDSCWPPAKGARGGRAAAPVPLRAGSRSHPPLRAALNFQLRPGSGGRTIQHGSGGGRDHCARQPEGRPPSALQPRPCAVRGGGSGRRLPLPPRRAAPRQPLANAAARALRLGTCQAGRAAAEAGSRGKMKRQKKRKERSPLSPPPPAPDGVRRAAAARRGPAQRCPGGHASRRGGAGGERGRGSRGPLRARGHGTVRPCCPGAGGVPKPLERHHWLGWGPSPSECAGQPRLTQGSGTRVCQKPLNL